MINNNNHFFKIGIVGPSRVGKTSLIASILNDSHKLLAGTPASIQPFGTKTERRIAQHHKELSGSLRAGEFNPGAVSGTEESFTYELKMAQGIGSSAIHFNILDFPGGWIDSDRRPPEREKEWLYCQKWLAESSVLIVPVESAVMMEAATSLEKKAVPTILNTYEVEQSVRQWAKSRALQPNEPALIMFCPVKCESYFADNGGQKDLSKDLLLQFHEYYREVIHTALIEFPDVKMIYAPVDTVGCVEIVKANWEGTKPGEMIFSANYRVRKPGHLSVKGADAVLINLSKHLLSQVLVAEKARVSVIKTQAYLAKNAAERDEGLIGNLWLWATNERLKRQETSFNLHSRVQQQSGLVNNMSAIIERLAGLSTTQRTLDLSEKIL
jgi:hypothetical protein